MVRPDPTRDRARELPGLQDDAEGTPGRLDRGRQDAAVGALPDLADLFDRRLPRKGLDDGTAEREPVPPFETMRPPTAPFPVAHSAPAAPVEAPRPLDGRRAGRRGPSVAGSGQAVAAAAIGASPHLLTALGAFALGTFGPLSGADRVPSAVLVVVLLQVTGYAVARAMEWDPLVRVWLANLAALGGLLPLLALLATYAGVPYVSFERASAGPLLLTGAATVVGLVLTALLVAALTWEVPEETSLLFVPAALLVPVVLLHPAEQLPTDALPLLALVTAASAAVVGLGRLLPRGTRPLVAPLALGGTFAVFLAFGQDPGLPESTGQVVPYTLLAVVVVDVLLTVGVPLLAVWLRRVAAEVRRGEP